MELRIQLIPTGEIILPPGKNGEHYCNNCKVRSHSVVVNFDFNAEVRGDTAEVTWVHSHGKPSKIYTLRAAAFDTVVCRVNKSDRVSYNSAINSDFIISQLDEKSSKYNFSDLMRRGIICCCSSPPGGDKYTSLHPKMCTSSALSDQTHTGTKPNQTNCCSYIIHAAELTALFLILWLLMIVFG